MHGNRSLTILELAEARRNRAAGQASLACEGMVLTAEENALFDRFDRERLPHDECRRQILEFIREKQNARVAAGT